MFKKDIKIKYLFSECELQLSILDNSITQKCQLHALTQFRILKSPSNDQEKMKDRDVDWQAQVLTNTNLQELPEIYFFVYKNT